MFSKLSSSVPKKSSNILPSNLCKEVEKINKEEDSQNIYPINNNPNQKNTQNVSKYIKNNINFNIFLLLGWTKLKIKISTYFLYKYFTSYIIPNIF